MVTPSSTSGIVSQAFRLMEVTPPSSLDDASDKARDAKEQYGTALGMCLELEDFGFARRYAIMPVASLPDGEFADPDLPYFFTLPDDLVKLRSVVDSSIKWRRDDGFVRTDHNQPLHILYTRMIKKESALPATFRTAVSYQLAILLAPTYVGARTKRNELKLDGADALRIAVQNDNVSASHMRWDGQADQGDWASEVTR